MFDLQEAFLKEILALLINTFNILYEMLFNIEVMNTYTHNIMYIYPLIYIYILTYTLGSYSITMLYFYRF
jgi:hypothetical protein